MARRLEADARRQEIAEAVLSLLAKEGLEATSVRDVAKEAGVSAGMVQHHFRTRDEMLRFACEYMVERTQHRISPLVAAIPEPRSIRTILGVLFRELLPLDEARRSEIRIWMAFLARAVVQPEMEAFMRATHEATHATIVGLLRHAAGTGELRPGVDIEAAATALFALTDGLVSHVLINHVTGDQALRAISDALGTFLKDQPEVVS